MGIILLALTASSVFISNGFADTIELNEVNLGYKSFFTGGHSPLITNNGLIGKSLDKQIDLHLKLNLFTYLYFNNVVHGTTDNTQFRSVGWKFELGCHITRHVDIEYHHHSQHALDQILPYHFPVEDSIGVNFNIYKSKKERENIF